MSKNTIKNFNIDWAISYIQITNIIIFTLVNTFMDKIPISTSSNELPVLATNLILKGSLKCWINRISFKRSVIKLRRLRFVVSSLSLWQSLVVLPISDGETFVFFNLGSAELCGHIKLSYTDRVIHSRDVFTHIGIWRKRWLCRFS